MIDLAVRRKQFRLQHLAVHLLFWMAYVLFEYLANMYHLGDGERTTFIFLTILSLPLIMLPTYFISWIAVPQFLLRKRYLTFALALIGVAVLVFFARIRWAEFANSYQYDYQVRLPVSKVFKNIIRDYSLIALAVCIHIIGDWRKKQQQQEQLIRAKAAAEMQLLKAQLHPHFLFNTLNNIYSQALVGSEQTAESILKLTELLDYFVYWAQKETVDLNKEIQLIQHYLELEKLRHGEYLQIESQFSVQAESIQLSPLLLLPFVENCFKHGGKNSDGIFKIDLYLSLDDQLLFTLSNTKSYSHKFSSNNGGLGLENIRKRLALIYPGRHQLDIQDAPGLFSVCFRLNYR